MKFKEMIIGTILVIFVITFLTGTFIINRYFKLRPIRKMETRIESLELRVETLEKIIQTESY